MKVLVDWTSLEKCWEGVNSPPGLELKFKIKKCVGLVAMFDKVRG